VRATKPVLHKRLIVGLYTGVAQPCLESRKTRWMLISIQPRKPGGGGDNGTAVLGLGNIGAPGWQPVMEGKVFSSKPSPISMCLILK